MKVLIIGSGGREHALAWKAAQSSRVKKIWCLPGNGGTAGVAQNVSIPADDLKAIANFALKESIDLTLVGPEALLVEGIVDYFEEKGLRIFGPTKEAARLEGSKIFAKQLLAKYGIPSADFRVFDKAGEAKDYLKQVIFPVVIKADGLCAGKGVIIAKSYGEAVEAIELLMEKRVFGSAGERIIIEDCLVGEEASIIVFTDGRNVVPLATSQDHKRAYDGDEGPNTGGMGAYSPAPVVANERVDRIMKEIIFPAVEGMAQEGKPYRGVLYAGIMMTEAGPKVLEFNVRFGDPETQAILPRMKSDIIEPIEAVIEGRLTPVKLEWDRRWCVCVVLASRGYPGEYEKGKRISGLEDVGKIQDIAVFHAGTKRENKKGFVTNGGRVLGVVGLAEEIEEAIRKTYGAIEKISFDGVHYRKDIGRRAIR